ncbi:MAG: cyclic peptide export ABC transporter, partial [Acidobacteriota bacterium]
MKVLHLIRRESKEALRSIPKMAATAGLSNALVLAVINSAAGHVDGTKIGFHYVVMFGSALGLYVLTQKYIMMTSTREVENMLHGIRLRIADKIRKADLRALEKIGRSEIYDSVNKATLTISQAAALLVVGCQSGLLIAFTLVYIGWLSRMALALFLVCFCLALAIYLYETRDVQRRLQESIRMENRLFDLLTDMLDGFKEVKMSQDRSDALYEHFHGVSRGASDLKAELQAKQSIMFIFTQTTFYLLVAAMVFVLPQFSETAPDVIAKVVTAILFILGPISSFVGAIPVFNNANAAADNIERLENQLDETKVHEPPPAALFQDFETLEADGLTFSYRDENRQTSFTVGPSELTIHKGEILFVTGGNGSGKSTFLKLLTALYTPETGVLRVDGKPVHSSNVTDYRALFSTIFSDYHLFARLYGVESANGRADELLQDLELDAKVHLTNGEFSRLGLSTGQRKRLALLVGLLEDKPIYVFDEWAADQDPAFRRKFYREILPDLKKLGKTVIAVTHDDHYFDAADRRFKMDGGQLEPA